MTMTIMMITCVRHIRCCQRASSVMSTDYCNTNILSTIRKIHRCSRTHKNNNYDVQKLLLSSHRSDYVCRSRHNRTFSSFSFVNSSSWSVTAQQRKGDDMCIHKNRKNHCTVRMPQCRHHATTYQTTTRPSSSSSSSRSNKPKAIFINSGRLNYDHQLNFQQWDTLIDCTYHHVDRVYDTKEIINLVTDHEILIVKEMIIPPEIIPIIASTSQQKNPLKLICEAGTGYNNIPIVLARQYNITVCNTPTYSTDAVAHMAVTYLMNFSCSMFQQQKMLLQKDRSNFTGPFTLPLHELNDKTIGLVGGSGKIGTKIAQIALVLGMKVIISSRKGLLEPNHSLYNHPSVQCTNDMTYLLQQSDYVSIHTPLNDETRRSFGRTQIEQMKSSAYLINTSRGGVIREDELIECMQQNRIAGAGLDVTTTEPPPSDSLLWNLSNVYLSPHTGWRRYETRQRLIDMTTDNIRAYCHATSPADYINVVNYVYEKNKNKIKRKCLVG
jgi:glycerate dehydrogenase